MADLCDAGAGLEQPTGGPGARVAGADAHPGRPARARALLALFVGTMASSFLLADRPDEAVADAALRIMGWDGPV